MKKLLVLAAFAVLLLSLPAAASAQATRTWVSGVGDDVNPCSRTAPCKTWAGAISKTARGGEMNALDSGGFGTLTITKSITVDGAGVHASTLSSGGINGISINITDPADLDARVVLRNLSINGTGTTKGLNGIRIVSARDVRLEHLRLATFTRNGVDAVPALTSLPDLTLALDDVTISDVGRNAVELVAPDPDHRMRVSVTDSVLAGAAGTTPGAPVPANTGFGLLADSGTRVWLGGTTIFDNVTGIGTSNSVAGGTAGIIDAACDNYLGGNGTNGTPSSISCPVVTNTVTNNTTTTVTQPAPPPVTVTNTVTVPAVVTPAKCKVPALKGLTKAAAAKKLKAARCALGTVTLRRTTNRKLVGKVTAQKVAAGKQLAAGTKIAVTLGK
jgi:hypothetical protein